MRDMEKEQIRQILAVCDHTLLAPQATWEQIRAICDDGLRYHTASVCIPPCFVEAARTYIDEEQAKARAASGKPGAAGAEPESGAAPLRVCTVIGFPNGYMTPGAKAFEAEDAVIRGADEIDMVLNIGRLKEKDRDYLVREIRKVKEACRGRVLKVIIETCLLTQEEKLLACEAVTEAGADFIKTSTGFSTGGATAEDVAFLRAHVGPQVKVKAAGGIGSLETAAEFMRLGADRLGTSRIVKIVKEQGLL